MDFAPSLWINKIVVTSSHTCYTQVSTPGPSFSHSTNVLGAEESLGLALEVLTLRECLLLCLLLQEKCLEQSTPAVEVYVVLDVYGSGWQEEGAGQVCAKAWRGKGCLCFFYKYLLTICFVQGTVLSTKNIGMKKT